MQLQDEDVCVMNDVGVRVQTGDSGVPNLNTCPSESQCMPICIRKYIHLLIQVRFVYSVRYLCRYKYMYAHVGSLCRYIYIDVCTCMQLM